MIQPNELRIGNFLVSETGEVLPVAYIMEDVIALHNTMGGVQKHQKNPMVSYDIEKLSPVYLSRDVLSKYADFVNKVTAVLRIDTPNRHEVLFFHMQQVGNDSPYFVDLFSFGTAKRVKEVKYLHELQNLFYCLTGFELELKSNSKTLK